VPLAITTPRVTSAATTPDTTIRLATRLDLDIAHPSHGFQLHQNEAVNESK